ncbi:SGNH/GDSL hydrolase family protein [Tomitella biformata]|uniref:SGNH/GDSL hydrolase family protein n=1 Tax=Tomitella biformata TaxID=630403 RepID=UPI0004666833|nr:SGNH/GDSL hydrolase family protein [Tomitella biformata]
MNGHSAPGQLESGQRESTARVYQRFVALGDSFTEGVGDVDAGRPNGLRGWADRVAEQLAANSGRLDGQEFGYANLAIRGRLLPEVISEQLEPAIALAPDLVTIYAGGNDLMRPSLDIDELIRGYQEALTRLVDTGATVLVFSAYDTGWAPVFRKLRGRIAIYNELLREAVENAGATLVDYWRMDGFDDTRMWDGDRLHMAPRGHALMAAEVLDLLGVPHSIERPVLPARPEQTKAQERAERNEWLRQFMVPWLSRRLRGISSGDGVEPKRPQLAPITG